MQMKLNLICDNCFKLLLKFVTSSCGRLQPSDAMLGPFGPTNRALQAHLKMLKIHLENFEEIHLENFEKVQLENFEEIRLESFMEINLANFEEIHLEN